MAAGTKKIGSKLDLTTNELLNAVIQVLSAAPSGKEGRVYFDSTKKKLGIYNGTEWTYGSNEYSLPEASSSTLGGIKLEEDLGGTAQKPKVVNLHLSGDTSIGHRLKEVSTPTEAKDAANKEYVDSKVAGLSWKNPVFAATAAALPAVKAIGTEELEAEANGALEIDGEKPGVGKRVLIKNQAEAKNDGVFEVVHAGGASEKFKLKRTSDANTTAELQDAALFAEKGATNEGHEFVQTAEVTTVATTSQVWVEFQSGLSIQAEGPYLERSGNKIKIVPVTAAHATVPAEGSISAAISGNARVKLFAFELAASVTELELEHKFGNEQVHFQAFENNGGVPGSPIELAWEPNGGEKVKITWPEAPAAKTVYFVSIVG
jgi:hypothetical protein